MAEKAKLFVGGLPQDVTEEEIRITFGTYGDVQDVHIMTGKSNSGQQCAFVCYEEFQAAEAAIENMDNIHSWREGDDKNINVRWAKAPDAGGGGGKGTKGKFVAPQSYRAPAPVAYQAPQTYQAPQPTQNKLFVGNIPGTTSQEEVQMLFSQFGNVTDCHLMAGKSTSGEMCAFVVLDNTVGADAAIKALDSVHTFPGSLTAIRVSWPKSRESAPPAGGKGGYGYAAPQQQYAPPQYQQQPLQPVQQQYRPMPVQGGYGGGYGAAAAAGVPAPPPPVRLAPGIKLFVGNLPQDLAKEALQTVFGTYGLVLNIHQMAGKSKSGQTCAFIEYATQLEAETAVLTLHERYEIRIGDGPILVKYANAKDGPPGGGARASPY